MSGVVYKVPPLSAAQIRDAANKIRSALKIDNTPLFPVMSVLEKVLDNQLDVLRFEVCPDAELHGAEGVTLRDDQGKDRIILPESVYHAAWNDDGRARFTAAHELGHWALHSTCALARSHSNSLRAFEDSEWQANTFAAEILMPLEFIYQGDTADDLMTRFRVSNQAAMNRIRNINKWGLSLKRKPSL